MFLTFPLRKYVLKIWVLLRDISLEAEQSYKTDQLSEPFFGLLRAYQIHSGLMYGTIVRHLGRNFLKLVS